MRGIASKNVSVGVGNNKKGKNKKKKKTDGLKKMATVLDLLVAVDGGSSDPPPSLPLLFATPHIKVKRLRPQARVHHPTTPAKTSQNGLPLTVSATTAAAVCCLLSVVLYAESNLLYLLHFSLEPSSRS